jgi:2-(1,2-epoxy-1,2-dihydrophenyl)acetyl-CoA isomerase
LIYSCLEIAGAHVSIEVGIFDGVATVTISQPSKRNAVSPAMWDVLADAFTGLSADTAVRVVMLTGAGSTFCAGSDLEVIDAVGGEGISRLKRANRMIQVIYNCEKPVLAAVRGYAVGVGWSIALACDLVLAAEDAAFVVGFTKVGLVPDGGALWFLSQYIGERRAKQIVFQARPVKATGLINEIVPVGDFDAAVAEFVGRLAEQPTYCLALTKRALRSAIGQSLGAFLDTKEAVQMLAKRSQDYAEGVLAFKAKRSPKFGGL